MEEENLLSDSARSYKEPHNLSDSEVNEALIGEDNKCKTDALLSVVLHGGDRRTAEDLCLRFLSDIEGELRSIALTCIGHIARIYGVIDRGRIVPLLESLKGDPVLGGRAEDALDDIEMYAVD